MRKWAVIALVSIGLAGVFAWLANRGPRSVEELKTRYNDTCSGRRYVWTEDLRQKWSRLTDIRMNSWAAQERTVKRIEKCEQALIKVGYLEERAFVVSAAHDEVLGDAAQKWFATRWWRRNQPVDMVKDRVLWLVSRSEISLIIVPENEIIARLRTQGTNLVIVVAPKEEMANWEKLVREADR